MKIFQVRNGFCWWDATHVVHSLDEASEMFAPDIVFVEAPDYVHEQWVFDESAEGDARFIQPEAPKGYTYDLKTGTFSPIERRTEAEVLQDTITKMRAMLAEAENKLAALNTTEE